MNSILPRIKMLIFLSLFLIFPFQVFANDNPGFTIQVPFSEKVITHRTFHHIVGLSTDNAISIIECAYPSDTEKSIFTRNKDEKQRFPREIQKLFPKDFLLTELVTSAQKPGNILVTEAYKFSETDKIDLRKFWESLEFRKVLATAYNDSVSQMHLKMSGFTLLQFNKSEHPQCKGKFVFTVPLKFGINGIQLTAKETNEKVLSNKEIQIFSDPIWNKKTKVPEGFTSYTFHGQASEKTCAACHTLKPQQELTPDATELFCRQCHQEIYAMNRLHQPVKQGMCFECHQPDGKYTVLETRNKQRLCLSCHNEASGSESPNPFKHAPIETGECTHCHDAHGTSFYKLMHQPVFETCLSCHDKKYEMNHPINGHPVHAASNPLDNAREFNCVSCHRPHSSDTEMLLIKEASCQACHKK